MREEIKLIDIIKFFKASTNEKGMGWSYQTVSDKLGITDAAIIKWVKKGEVPEARRTIVTELFRGVRFTEMFDIGEEPATAAEIVRQIRDSGFPLKQFKWYSHVGPGMNEAFYNDPEAAGPGYLTMMQVAFRQIKAEFGVSHDLFDNFMKSRYTEKQPEINRALPGGATQPF